MRGPLIQTEARAILNQGISQGISMGISQGISECKKEIAFRMLIAEYSALSVAEVEQLANSQRI